MPEDRKALEQFIEEFCVEGEFKDCAPFGNGHINRTYRVRFSANGEEKDYIFQEVNHSVFKNVKELMENIWNVTTFLHKKILEAGGDPEKECLTLIPTKDGRSYLETEDGRFFRVFRMIPNSLSLDLVRKPEEFRESGYAFGRFQSLLADYPAETLHEIIPNFHNTEDRFRNLQNAVEKDTEGRAAHAKPEIDFAFSVKGFSTVLEEKKRDGSLPLHVTHNDTKLNNVLLSADTEKALCVIDLDTVMPGTVLNDFGDSIRFGASTALEDERDLDKVHFSLSLFRAYAEGYLSAAGKSLNSSELSLLSMGAMVMTYECGIRFLTDYLQGDVYFHTNPERKEHNLDRARTQFKLVSEMMEAYPEMQKVIRELSAEMGLPFEGGDKAFFEK